MAKNTKIPITRRALEQRLRRSFAKDGERLVADRYDPGHYYVVDEDGRVLVRGRTLLSLAKDMMVLRAFEELSEKEV